MIKELFETYVSSQGVEATAAALHLTSESIEKVIAGTAMLRQVDCERLLELTGSRLVQGTNGESADAISQLDAEQSSFSMEPRKLTYPLSILIPYVGSFPGIVVASLLYYAKHLDIGFELQGNSLLSRARNDLAMRFLRSTANWSLWLDKDVIMPFGNPEIFIHYTRSQKLAPKFAAYNTITRLLSHKQPLIGGVYAARQKGGSLVIQPELQPRNPNDQRVAAAIREGKEAGGLHNVGWLAAGLMLVHRKVFQTIMTREPVAGEVYPFFLPENASDGEDVAFCKRAIRAGFTPVLDTEIRAGHIGLGVWLPEDSAPPVKVGGK
jgi:hypothetical protein